MPDDYSIDPSEAEAADSSGGGTHAEEVERLFREQNESLLRFLRARLHSSQEAKEVAQEAYVQLLGLDEGGTVSYLQAYLFRTAANIASNRLKQRNRRRQIDELVFFEAEDRRSPEHSWAARQELALIRRAIDELPPNCRMAFLLVKFDDLSIDEAAKRLGLHPRRVRRYVARAMAHCHTVLQDTGRSQGEST